MLPDIFIALIQQDNHHNTLHPDWIISTASSYNIIINVQIQTIQSSDKKTVT